MRTHVDRRRVVVVATGFLGFFLVATLQVVHLGFVAADDLAGQGERQRHRTIVLPAERGPIVDRNGDALALTVESASVFARPRNARLGGDQVDALAEASRLSPEYVRQRLASASPFVWLRRNATPSQADAVVSLELPGIGSEPSRTRVYPRGPLAGQILGFAGVDGEGLEGIELAYDRHLRSEPEAVVVERDARGSYVLSRSARSKAPRGASIELTIDADLQRIVEDALSAKVLEHEAASGVAIVMDVSTGEILAMANAPLFDPNRSDQRTASRWRNQAILDRFEPGSTFKSFLAAAAIEAGEVWPEKRMFCENGRYRIGRRTIHDHDPYGWLTFSDVIRVSSNICTAKVAQDLGVERFDTTLRAFGVGSLTGIDLAHEASGYLPPAKAWRPINLATISYGHGVSVTPLQLVRAYAALANGGRLLRPYIVSRVIGDDGRVLVENSPKVVGLAVSPGTAETVTRMLESVVTDGTGKAAAVDGVPVAGKTGTTRKIGADGRYSRRDYVASFVGYLPSDAPRFAILVVIDTPRGVYYGGSVSAPVFRVIGEYLADRAGLRALPAPVPSIEETIEGVNLARWGESAGAGMPSYIGLSLREVLTQASSAGWEVEVEGAGFVVDQDPPPGAELGRGRTLRLRLGSALG
jgi:cell division protein FtsI (penicillin-binding protein 3)